MMEAAEDRDDDDILGLGLPRRCEVSCAIRRLHPKAPMGPAMIDGPVLSEDVLNMVLVTNDDVIDAVPAEVSGDR
jgi:hypothetical protein